jgi:hypothetical protein
VDSLYISLFLKNLLMGNDVAFQVTFYEAMKELTEYGKTKYLPNSDLDVSNSFEGLVLGGLAGGMSGLVYVNEPDVCCIA